MRKIWLVAGAGLTVAAAAAVVFIASDSEAKPPAGNAAVALSNRVAATGLEGRKNSMKLFRIDVPSGAHDLAFTTYGDGKNAEPVDLYVRFGSPPERKTFDDRDIGPDGTKLVFIRAPHPGAYYALVRGAHGGYSDVSLVASYASPGESFKVGMHAHHLYNRASTSTEPHFGYGLIRDWDISGLHDAAIWKSDGSIDFNLVDQVYEGHARHGARVIKTFGTVPTWEAKRPGEPNKQFPSWSGGKSGPRDLNEYEDYVYRFVSHEKNALWAVEGWNEPYACEGKSEFTTMTPTELADVQKRVFLAAKRANPHILVLSPAQAYLCGIPTVLGARTSQGEPIWKFFDALAWHAYNRSAKGDAGPSYAQEVMKVRGYLAAAGLKNMPIADTEHGWLEAPKEGGREFHDMTDEQKARVLFETAALAKSLGVIAVVWYGYDDSLIGKPMTSEAISQGLEQMYEHLNTFGSAALRPARYSVKSSD